VKCTVTFCNQAPVAGKFALHAKPGIALLWIVGENQAITDPNTRRVNVNRLPNQTADRQNIVLVAIAEDSVPALFPCRNPAETFAFFQAVSNQGVQGSQKNPTQNHQAFVSLEK